MHIEEPLFFIALVAGTAFLLVTAIVMFVLRTIKDAGQALTWWGAASALAGMGLFGTLLQKLLPDDVVVVGLVVNQVGMTSWAAFIYAGCLTFVGRQARLSQIFGLCTATVAALILLLNVGVVWSNLLLAIFSSTMLILAALTLRHQVELTTRTKLVIGLLLAIAVQWQTYPLTYIWPWYRAGGYFIFSVLLTALHISLVYKALMNFRDRVISSEMNTLAANMDLEFKNQELEHLVSEAMKSREQQAKVFAIVSHELRTPAAAIKMLIEDLTIPWSQLREIRSVSSHLVSVIDDLRMSINPSIEADSKLEKFTLQDLLNQVHRQVEGIYIHEGLSLDIDSEGLPGALFESDIYRIRTIMTNLLRNAAYHSEGKKVCLSMEFELLTVALGELQIVIEDDGKGIPDADRERIFNANERLESRSAGTGLGLHIVREWAENLGGSVQISSSSMGGARFSVVLPIKLSNSASEEKNEQSDMFEAQMLLAGKTVLLAEDDRILQRLTAKVLNKNFDINLLMAANGSDALKQFESNQVHLLITDYFMPKMDGKELIEALVARGNRPPILAVTAAMIGQEYDELSSAGADKVLAKPLEINEFTAAVCSVMGVAR